MPSLRKLPCMTDTFVTDGSVPVTHGSGVEYVVYIDAHGHAVFGESMLESAVNRIVMSHADIADGYW